MRSLHLRRQGVDEPVGLVQFGSCLRIVQPDQYLSLNHPGPFARQKIDDPPGKLAGDRDMIALNAAVRLN
jgi:hypothetical protein